jgi:acylphosphatase
MEGEPAAARVRTTVYYSGQVQGVGFRATAASVARDFDVTGYVRNLPDGRVELVAEAAPAELDRFLDGLAKRMQPCIERAERRTAPAAGGLHRFAIRY